MSLILYLCPLIVCIIVCLLSRGISLIFGWRRCYFSSYLVCYFEVYFSSYFGYFGSCFGVSSLGCQFVLGGGCFGI
jgi:hypothetical protein